MRFWARHGWFIAIAVTYLYVFPYFPKIHSANELPRIYLVKAIADDHTFAIDRGVKRWGATADVSPAGGHSYSNKAPGSSMLAAPPYLAVRVVAGEPGLAASMWIARVFGSIVPALAFLLLLYRFLARYVPDPAIRQLVCIAYGLGSLAMTYSILYYSHQLAAACIASAWILGLDAAERRRWGLFAASGALAGCAVLVDYQAAFAAVPVAVHVLVKLLDGRSAREVVTALAIVVGAAAVPIAILLGYHAACFGSPFRTGYDASTTFAHHHQQGFLGITELRWEAFVGSTVKLDNGLVALAPWWLLAIPGMFVLARGLHTARVTTVRTPIADRLRATLELGVALAIAAAAIGIGLVTAGGIVRDIVIVAMLAFAVVGIVIGAARLAPARNGDLGSTVVALAVLAIYLAFISSITFWRGGWGVGPRYIAAMLPFLLPAVAVMLVALQRWNRLALGAATGTIVVGVVIYTLSSVTFPYWPDSAKHPLFEVTFRMLASDLAAPNLANLVGIDGVLAIAPIVVGVAAQLGWTIRRVAGWSGLGLAVAVAAMILVIYGAMPHGGAQADRVFKTVRNAVVDL